MRRRLRGVTRWLLIGGWRPALLFILVVASGLLAGLLLPVPPPDW